MLKSSPSEITQTYQSEFSTLLKVINNQYQAELDQARLVGIILFTRRCHATPHANPTTSSNSEELKEILQKADAKCSELWPADLEEYREDMLCIVKKYYAIIDQAGRLGVHIFGNDGNFTGWIAKIAEEVKLKGGGC